jgi:glycosidase
VQSLPWTLALVLSLIAGCSKLPAEVTFDGPLAPRFDGPTIRRDGTLPGSDAGQADGGGATGFDWRDGIMYFVLLDRFLDGDASNNKPESGVETPANWQGGDLAGLLAKLKSGYFSSLGINVLWLSSPVDAPDGKFPGKDAHDYTGFHGYWPRDLGKVEGRLGDLALLKQVVSEAHKLGIRIVVDYVMNHVHQQSPVYTSHGDWFWPLDAGGKSCICGSGCSWQAPEGLRCWFDPFLPDFNFTVAATRTFSVENALGWIKEVGIDGLRLDAVKHVELSWLTELRARINGEIVKPGQRFYLIGETFDGERALIKEHVDPATKLDGQFDFPLRAQLVKNLLMRQGGLDELETFLNSNDGYYGKDALMGTFLGNHDLPRAIHLAEDTAQFSEWDAGKTRAWTNLPAQPTGAAPYQRLALAFTVLFTLPGLPTIYYGDELGMAGGGDPDNRRPMLWTGASPDQEALRTTISKLAAVRKQHPALRRGTRKELWLGAEVYAYRMSEGSDQLVIVINRSDVEQTIQLPASSYQDLLRGVTLTGPSFKLAPRSSYLLQ